MAVACIANSDTTAGPEVPLWECPCRECWSLEMDLLGSFEDMADQRVPYATWRDERTEEA
jgi:hypothetical protein